MIEKTLDLARGPPYHPTTTGKGSGVTQARITR